MKAKESDWPRRPKHITNDGKSCAEKDPEREDLSDLTGGGIIPNEHLQGIETAICANLKYPTTFIEFSPEGKPVKTNSPLLDMADPPFGLRLPCRVLRYGIDSKYCNNCDWGHALLFRGLTKSNVYTEAKKKEKNSEYITKYISEDPDLHIDIKKEQGREYVEYDCPLLGYRELAFPVFFEDKVIAVFITGQICLREKLRFIVRKQEEFFNKHKECYEEYCKVDETYKPDEIREKLSKMRKTWMNDPSSGLDEAKYREVIRISCKELDNLENTLEGQMKSQREQYVSKRVDNGIEEFRRNLPVEEMDSDKKRELMWRNVEDRLQYFIKEFNIEYAVVFASQSLIQDQAVLLNVVAAKGKLPDSLAKSINSGKLKFNMRKVKIKSPNQLITSEDERDIFKALEGWDRYDEEMNLIRVFLVPLFHQASLVVLVGYNKDNPLGAPENGKDGIVGIGLQSFYTVVLSALASVLAGGAEDTAKRQLQYLGHEAGQLVAGLDWLRISYFEDAEALKSQLVNKLQDICQDLDGFIGQMAFIFDMASQMGTGVLPEVEMTEFKPFGDVLFKWKDAYRLEIERKCIQIRVATLKRDISANVIRDPLRPSIYADRFLFEQIVYNLVNNAEKYCYRGTKIDLDCKLRSLEDDGSPHVLTVTNYGRYMAPGDDVYLPFVRRATAGDVEGLGLGLYIAWLIVVKVHGGTIRHNCDKESVSWFNIPLIKPYIERTFTGKDSDLTKKLERELRRLTTSQEPSHRYDHIVAFSDIRQTPKYDPLDNVLRNEISKPTYKVTITATIPVQKRRS